jgi:hypothetical protein
MVLATVCTAGGDQKFTDRLHSSDATTIMRCLASIIGFTDKHRQGCLASIHQSNLYFGTSP